MMSTGLRGNAYTQLGMLYAYLQLERENWNTAGALNTLFVCFISSIPRPYPADTGVLWLFSFILRKVNTTSQVSCACFVPHINHAPPSDDPKVSERSTRLSIQGGSRIYDLTREVRLLGRNRKEVEADQSGGWQVTNEPMIHHCRFLCHLMCLKPPSHVQMSTQLSDCAPSTVVPTMNHQKANPSILGSVSCPL